MKQYLADEETVMRISRGLNEPKWLLNERLRAFHIFQKLLLAEKNRRNFQLLSLVQKTTLRKSP